MLADGTYDAFVIDADDGEGGDAGLVRLDVTITSGDHKGDVVSVRGRIGTGSGLDLLGLPVTLEVEDGVPRLSLG